MDIKLGHIYFADLNGKGHQQQGVRPVLITSNNIGNKFAPIITALPFTSQKKDLPTHIKITPNENNKLKKISWVIAEQPLTLNKTQIMDYLGYLTEEELHEVSKGMLIQMPFIAKAVINGFTKHNEYQKVALA